MEIVLFHIWPRPGVDEAAYGETFERMVALVSDVPGFISIEAFSSEDGSELAVARFENEEAILAWRNHAEHARTRDRGRYEFFDAYEITVSRMTRGYHWRRGEPVPDFSTSA